ncbi:hypothetical protein NKR23_g1247 [Pleurostoma richardsiae]|uniref:Uncharacterized protein n=1 Tax=Pleurostoma richardsiae TaxID=41990 RepID=A0AA38RZL6_9PEZI|nr:hypothetical protein NKR23_g1247 [Pleurostoma richardsiae]
MFLASSLTLGLLVSSGAAYGQAEVPPPIAPTKLENFTWTDPFSSPQIGKFEAACEAQRTFPASEYLLHDLRVKPPEGLSPYAEALKKFFTGRPYPGGWDGMDAHRYERNLLLMEYAEIPLKARAWIEEQERTEREGKGLFAVYEKPVDGLKDVVGPVKFPEPEKAGSLRPLDKLRVAVFAPGAIYEILPLWVAEGSNCEAALLDLSKYSSKISDGGVVGWPTSHTEADRKKGMRNIEFTIKAQVLKSAVERVQGGKEKVDAGEPQSAEKDEL